MAGVERFELPTRAVLVSRGIRCSANGVYILDSESKKALAFLLEP